jgi:hypothetical protein
LFADVGECQSRAIAILILPEHGDATRIASEMIDRVAEVEVRRRIPAEITIAPLIRIRIHRS